MPEQRRQRAVPILETPLLHSLMAAASTTGWLAYHALPARLSNGRIVTHALGNPGFPDLVLVHPRGGILFRELKAEGRYPSPAQRRWLEAVTTAAEVGCSAGVWRPRDQKNALDQLGGQGTWRP